MLQHIVDHIFQHCLRQIHIILQICKCHLRLDHPEFCRVAGRIGILSTEGRSKSINIFKCHRVGLSVELSADRQIGRFSKEILLIIHTAILGARDLVQIHRRHLEHLTGSFAVTSCNDRCVHIDKVTLLEKFVDRIGNQGAHAEHCLKGIGSRTQM